MNRPSDISEQVWMRASILMDELRHYQDDLEYTARLIMALDRPEPKPFIAGMTSLQSRVMAFIDGYQAAHRFSPSYGEIAEACGICSKSGVHRVVHSLVERGAIRMLPGHGRSIELLRRPIGRNGNVSSAHQKNGVA